ADNNSSRQWIAVEAEETRSATEEDSKSVGEIVGDRGRGRNRRSRTQREKSLAWRQREKSSIANTEGEIIDAEAEGQSAC
ncbi:hypothetical protein BHE74_00038327, partial [Ensete ventricosum]